jgi:hypothetical protein
LDEVQDQLDEKVNKSDIPTLDEVPTKTDLSAVALSNNYLDLDNKPCYETGVELNVTFASGYEVASKDFLKSDNLRFIKIADYDTSKRVQDYIDGFVSISYQFSTTTSKYTYTESSNWIIKDSGIAIYEFKEGYTKYIYAAIVSKDNLTCTLINGDNITFSSSGIYVVADTRGYTTMPNQWYYISNIQFKTIYYPIDINLLPQNIIDLQTTKVDVDPNARLMTNSEASKLSSIEANANNYTLPPATTTTLGGVKVGDNLSISEDGTISATSLDWDNVDGKPELYTKDEVYTKSEVNIIKSNLETSIDTTKTTLTNSINTKVDKIEGSRLMTNAEGTKLDGIEKNANNYTLPAATTSSLGGVKVGANLSVTEDGTISATSLDWNNVEGKPELYTKSEVYTKTEVDTSLNTKQDKSNLVTSVNSSSTDEEYPSAKLLYTTKNTLQSSINTNKTNLENSINTTKSDLESSITTTKSELKAQIDNKQDVSNLVTSISSSSTDTKYPSAKLLYTTKTGLETQINTKQDKSNLVTSVNSSSTDEEYPSAKLLYTTKNTLQSSIDTKQNISNLVTTIDENSTDTQYPSAKLLYDIVGNYDILLNEINTLIGEQLL